MYQPNPYGKQGRNKATSGMRQNVIPGGIEGYIGQTGTYPPKVDSLLLLRLVSVSIKPFISGRR